MRISSTRTGIEIYDLSQKLAAIDKSTYHSKGIVVGKSTMSTCYTSDPHKSNFYGIGICTGGTHTLKTDYTEYALNEGSVTILLPGTIRSWHDAHQYESSIVFFHELFLAHPDMLKMKMGALLTQSQKPRSFRVNDEQKNVLLYIHKAMQALYESASSGREEALRKSLDLLIHQVNEIYRTNNDDRETRMTQPEFLVDEFKGLIHKHYKQHHDVGFYAEVLKITPGHLSDTVRHVRGKGTTPRMLIEAHVIKEAQVLLIQSNLSVKEIAYEVGYDDAGHFTKAFTRLERIPPTLYKLKKSESRN